MKEKIISLAVILIGILVTVYGGVNIMALPTLLQTLNYNAIAIYIGSIISGIVIAIMGFYLLMRW